MTTQPPSRTRVLVAIAGTERPYHALIRGYRLANACDAELVVIHVLAATRSWKTIPRRHGHHRAEHIERDLELVGTTAMWCDQVLPEPLGDRYVVRHGTLIDELAAEVARGPTRLIVVAADSVEARHASQLATDVHVPVLLARPRSSNSIVVAATDLRHARYPVIAEAADLAPAMAARLVCIHNRPPVLPGIDPMTAMFLEPSSFDTSEEEARTLRAVATALSDDAESVITGQARPVDAILEVARAQDADLIVVGAARHSSIYRWLTGSTAAAVARRARRSVLLAPLDDAGAPA